MSNLAPKASASRYEEALANLGAYLGFDAERPEKVYGVGPDVLWRTDAAFDFVIEVKSKKDEDNPLYKKDHAQFAPRRALVHADVSGPRGSESLGLTECLG